MMSTKGCFGALPAILIVVAAPLAAAVAPGPMEEVVVVATRTEKALRASPWSVGVLDTATLQRQTADQLADVLRDMPGIYVSDAGEAGQKRIRIRGEEARRMALLIDGEEFIDHHEVGVPLLVDMAHVARVEVIRGPASVLYGGKAMGGVINVITDTTHDAPLEGRVRTGYDSSTQGWIYSVGLGGRQGDNDWQLDFSDDLQHDRKTPAGTLDNTSYASQGYSASVKHRTGPQSFGVRYERFDSNAEVYVDPAVRFTPPFLDFSLNIPARNRNKLRLDYAYQETRGPFRALKLDAYRQVSDRDFNTTTLMQFAPALPVQDTTILTSSQLISKGFNLQTDWAPHTSHDVVAGIQYVQDKVSQTRDRTVSLNGSPSFAETVFDAARLATTAIYAEDDWTVTPWISLIAGARAYTVDGELSGSTRLATLPSFSDRHAIASLALVYDVSPSTTLRADVAEGYIYPSLFNLAIGAFAGSQFVNPVAGLRPETSTTRELGARFVDDRFMFELTLFHTSANDYIDHVNCDTGDPCLTTADQIYKNVGSATTFGLESSARFSVDTTTVYADITWLRRHKQYEGVDTFNAGVPMLSGRLGVERNIGDELHVDLFSRFESSADTTEMTRRGATTDHHGGFATLNTELNWNLSGVVRINVGLENLADRRYSFATENLLAPGRHVSASIAMEF